jgi:phage portal protein BeeE
MRALQESTCMACVSIRAADLAKLPMHVYRTTPNGGQEIATNHAVERLLRKPNQWQTKLRVP